MDTKALEHDVHESDRNDALFRKVVQLETGTPKPKKRKPPDPFAIAVFQGPDAPGLHAANAQRSDVVEKGSVEAVEDGPREEARSCLRTGHERSGRWVS